jgi:hypothetical protein
MLCDYCNKKIWIWQGKYYLGGVKGVYERWVHKKCFDKFAFGVINGQEEK